MVNGQHAEGRGKFIYHWVTDKLCHLSKSINNLTASTSKPYFLSLVKSVIEICSDHSSQHYQKFDVSTTVIVCTYKYTILTQLQDDYKFKMTPVFRNCREKINSIVYLLIKKHCLPLWTV